MSKSGEEDKIATESAEKMVHNITEASDTAASSSKVDNAESAKPTEEEPTGQPSTFTPELPVIHHDEGQVGAGVHPIECCGCCEIPVAQCCVIL